jgi:hypothetical protein
MTSFQNGKIYMIQSLVSVEDLSAALGPVNVQAAIRKG